MGSPDASDDPDFDANSVLSHGERRIANHLHEDPGATPAEIAEALGGDAGRTDAEAVAKSVERIREKTARALATLDQSPFVGEAVDDHPDLARRVAAGLDPDRE
jgi:hypothetical protein